MGGRDIFEPDQKYGHGYLNAVYEVKKNFVSNQKNLRKFNLKTTNKKHAVPGAYLLRRSY